MSPNILHDKKMIPIFSLFLKQANIFGFDMNKKGTTAGSIQIPEALGIVPAFVFLIFNMIGILYTKNFHKDMVLMHTAGILSICFIVFLGFCDDNFNF